MKGSWIFFAVCLLIGGHTYGEEGVGAGILPENCYRFLKLGQVNYSINVSPEAIRYGEDRNPADVKKDIDQLKAEIRKKPSDLKLKLTLADLYAENGMYAEQKSLFAAILPDLKKRADREKTEEALLWYARALSVSSDNKRNDEAHLLLQPLLESAKASKKAFELAIGLRIAVRDFNLAVRIADAYATVYPDDPDPYYQRFMNVFAKNLTGIIPYLYNTAAGEYLKGKGAEKLEKEDLGGFLNAYFSKINEALGMSDLDRAVSLAPESYKYNLSAGVFRSLVLFYTSMAAKSQVAGLDETSVVEAFKSTDASGLAPALAYLKKALALRPERDIQVFLGLAMYHLCEAEYDRAQSYANQAIETRPADKAGYDALITTIALPGLTSGTGDLETLLSRIEGILAEKIAKAGGSPDDYATLAGLGLKRYGSADEAERKAILNRMLDDTNMALKMEPGHNLALLIQATHLMLSSNYKKALELMNGLEPAVKDGFKDMLYNNRGVLKILMGSMEEGIADLKKAMELTTDNATTRDALKAIGISYKTP